MSIWGAVIGGAIGIGRGAYTHHSDVGKTKRARNKARKYLEELPEDYREHAQTENTAYLRSLGSAFAKQRIGAGSAGLAALRNQAEAQAQGLADLGIGRRESYLDETRRREGILEDAQGELDYMRTPGSILDYGGKYIAKGAAIGASMGAEAANDEGAHNWEADSKKKKKELSKQFEDLKEQNPLLAKSEQSTFAEGAGGLAAPPSLDGSSAWAQESVKRNTGSQAQPLVRPEQQQLQRGIAGGTPPMRGGDSSSGYLNSLGRLRLRNQRRY